MDLYSAKQRWKVVLIFVSLLIIGASLFVSNQMIQKIAERERSKAKEWAGALKKKVELVELNARIFKSLREREREKIELVVAAQKTLLNPSDLSLNQDLAFTLSIIESNKDIPVILLNDDGTLAQFRNLDTLYNDEKHNDEILALAKKWKAEGHEFKINVFGDMYMSFIYGESQEYLRLQKQSDSLILSFNKDLGNQSNLIPVLFYDVNEQKVISTNLSNKEVSAKQLNKTIANLKAQNLPIRINFGEGEKILYFSDSPEVKQLIWLPYIQFGVVGLIVIIGYLLFSTYRKAEQNQVWAGLAKETAHQLGTPLSSLMAWVSYLENEDVDPMVPREMQKDLQRLEKITDRFSKIGSGAKLVEEDFVFTIENNLNYLKARLSDKIDIQFTVEGQRPMIVLHNRSLMEWVVENICKNAVDAMGGVGKLHVHIKEVAEWVHVDITDTGKGLTAKQIKSIFQPGYSTKKRGWGLGLTLVKRIVEEYHKGRVFVVSSELDKGTTFRISIPH
jgi:signal transduction histidine kinase